MRTTGTTPSWRRTTRRALACLAGGALCLTLMAQGEGTVYQATTTHKCKKALQTVRTVTVGWSADGAIESVSTNKSGKKTEVVKIIVKQNDEELQLDQGGETGGDYSATVLGGAQPGDGANVTLQVQPIGECGFTAKPKAEEK